jgi:protein-S-isoprenylcysteine O-methyltransferase Ste14
MRQPVPAGNHRSRHTQERVSAGEAIGGRDAAAPHGGRARAGRIGTLLLDRALPATLIGFLAAVKGWLTVQAAAALTAIVASGPWPFGGAALPGGLLADLPGPLPGAALHLAVEALGLAYYGLIAVLFVVRLPRLGGRRRPLTVVVALFGALALLGIGVLPGDQPHPALDGLASVLLAAGLAYSIWALAHLNRSFSILPESRRLVRDGPYALSRHPLYLGEAVASVGVLLPVAGPAALALWALFLAAQLQRIRWEEAVLRERFPAYEAYARRVPRYLPFAD